MIREQIHLVHVKDAAVRRCQKTWLERLLARTQGPLDIEGSRKPVCARPHRQLHEPHRTPLPGRALRMWPRRAPGAEGLRIAGIRAADDHFYGWQEPRERPHGSGLRGPFLAAHQNTADLGRYGVEEQGELELLLADYGGEGVRRVHAKPSSNKPSFSRYAALRASRSSGSGSDQRPRSAASRRRSEIARRAQGFDSCMKSRTPSSRTYLRATSRYIQSSTTPAVAS